MTNRTLTTIILVLTAGGIAGCGSSSTPSAPTVAPTPSPPALAPTVTSISPTVGSTGGATEVKITGVSLGTTVTFGGSTVEGRFDGRYPGTVMLLSTPVHAAGTVDVVIGGPNRPAITLPNAFTYASPQTFDFNGRWSGFGRNGQDNLIRFTIQDNMLLTVSCDSFTTDPDTVVTFAPPRPVMNGEFSFDAGGVNFSGRIVSSENATGTIRLGDCASAAWYAVKQ